MALTKRRMTEAALAANRANALKSTGPRTAAGKARSRLNGLKHGGRSAFAQRYFRLWFTALMTGPWEPRAHDISKMPIPWVRPAGSKPRDRLAFREHVASLARFVSPQRRPSRPQGEKRVKKKNPFFDARSR